MDRRNGLDWAAPGATTITVNDTVILTQAV
jgi:hypothetical protein